MSLRLDEEAIASLVSLARRLGLWLSYAEAASLIKDRDIKMGALGGDLYFLISGLLAFSKHGGLFKPETIEQYISSDLIDPNNFFLMREQSVHRCFALLIALGLVIHHATKGEAFSAGGILLGIAYEAAQIEQRFQPEIAGKLKELINFELALCARDLESDGKSGRAKASLKNKPRRGSTPSA